MKRDALEFIRNLGEKNFENLQVVNLRLIFRSVTIGQSIYCCKREEIEPCMDIEKLGE